MRRFPSSWDRTLAGLGFRRNVKRVKREFNCRQGIRIEPLERREMLASDLYVVSTSEDIAVAGTATDNLWSLREALAHSALDDDGIDRIEFAPELADQTITLGSRISIGSDVVIDGSDASDLTISGGDSTRLFILESGVAVTLSDLTLTEGYSGVSGDDGGAIHSFGDLTIERVHFLDNEVPDKGGAIYAQDGTLSVTDSEFVGNRGEGGGIYVYQIGVPTADIESSTFQSNTSALAGGAIRAYGNRTAGSSLRVANSTFYDNEARYSGGAISGSSVESLEIVNSTIVGNRSTEAYGGGIGTWQSSSLVLQNSIVASNTSFTHSNDLYANSSLSGVSGGNFVGGNPYLQDLGDYGGLTRTMPPLPNSPVIDAGDGTLSVPATDQRGLPRLVDSGDPDSDGSLIDIGAYERQTGEDIVVNVVTDGSNNPGEITLRQAIALAASLPGPDTIRFDTDLFASSNPSDPPLSVARTFVLGDTNGDGISDTTAVEMLIDSDLTIAGPGSELLTIDAAGGSRAFRIWVGSVASLKDLTVTGGSTTGDGGGAVSSGELTLERTVWTGNTSGSKGGAIKTYNTDLKIYDSTFDGNQAYDSSGAIFFQAYVGRELIISRSTISNNSLTTGGGSGLEIYAYSATSASITNSTFSGNVAPQGSAIKVVGNAGLDVDIVNSTIAYNGATARYFPGGIWDHRSGSSTTLTNSIVAHNIDDSDGPDSDAYDFRGYLNGTHNVLGAFALAGFVDGVDGNVVIDVDGGDTAGLMPLDSYGGYTKTHALLPNSVALENGELDYEGAMLTDQRGGDHARVQYGRIDAGAVEFGTVVFTGGTSDDTIHIYADRIEHWSSIDPIIKTVPIDAIGAEKIVVEGGAGNDIIIVQDNVGRGFTIRGGAGDDYIAGSVNDDIIDGGGGTDTLDGGEGNDTYVFRNDVAASQVTISDADGVDTFDFSKVVTADPGYVDGVTIDLSVSTLPYSVLQMVTGPAQGLGLPGAPGGRTYATTITSNALAAR